METRRAFGMSAVILGAFLCWYAVWTIVCNALVLSGAHFGAFLWAPVVPSVVTIAALIWRGSWVRWAYAGIVLPPAEPTLSRRGPTLREWLVLGCAAAVALAAADIGQRSTTTIACIVASIVVALVLAQLEARGALARLAPTRFEAGWRVPVLIVILLIIYYFAHRADGDDANFVNLAIGAKRTIGAVFQYDTMIGDGPHPIHLPTYKFHSFEILGAVLSSYTGLAPIIVFHLLMPAVLVCLLGLSMFVTLASVNGRYWFAASLIGLGFLFMNEQSVGGWGLHSVIRFYQGKGFFVSVILPLIAALTARWFVRGERIDLIGLTLANVCAVGFSANGLFGGPAASAFVAAAFVVSDWRNGTRWRRAIALVPTLAWPAMVAVVIIIFKLAFPSEFTEPLQAIAQLNFDTWFGLSGRITLAVILFGALGLMQSGVARPSLWYIPIVMLLTLNPFSWQVISAITGNLGFRIFWSIPAAAMIGSASVALIRLAGVRSEAWITLGGAAALAAGIGFISRTENPVTTIRWHWPDLKVIRADRDVATRLAEMTPAGCNVLAPEVYSMQLSTIEGAPYPVFVRELYLIHYRFTMPPGERRVRDELRRFAAGGRLRADITPEALAGNRIRIGAFAVPRGTPAAADAPGFARMLGLAGPVAQDGLLIWRGPCNGARPIVATPNRVSGADQP